jgi:hypothetical protein
MVLLSQNQQAQYRSLPLSYPLLVDGHRPEPAGPPSKAVSTQNNRTLKRKRSYSEGQKYWLDILKKNPGYTSPLNYEGTEWKAEYLIKGSRRPKLGGKGNVTYAVKWVGWPDSTRELEEDIGPGLINAYLKERLADNGSV